MDPEKLTACAIELKNLAKEGERWLTDNEEAQGDQSEERKNLRRCARHLNSIYHAAANKMGIAVFGPSQVGKSTLISALAKPKRGKLMVDFQGTLLDFINQVNPTGGKETTALVTRFSIDKPPKSPDDSLPVCLKIFSEMDVLKILANTYFAEGQGAYKIDQDELSAVLTDLAKKLKTPANAPTIDDMEDFKEYVDNISRPFASGEHLIRLFWPSAVDLAQKLDIEDRAQLFSFIWGRVDEFTRLYVLLYKHLEKLSFPEVAFTSVKAIYDESLKPQDGRLNSVLHVDRLLGLLNEDQSDTIPVVSASGRKAEWPRPVLCALIAEIHALVSEAPGEFMDNADILDFPGYRSRNKYENFREALKKPEEVKNCFLRGKVAYMFQRYSANKEITIMLLCIKHSNMDIADLPEAINAWINESHGSTPEERWGKPVCLFFVLTFFNTHMQRLEGSTDLKQIWDTRLAASLTQPFGVSEWPETWARNGRITVPFNNCFWLLNVYISKTFLNVTALNLENGTEVELSPMEEDNKEETNTVYIGKGIRQGMEGWLGKLREAFLATPAVQKHFAHPGEAWDGAVLSEDGGCDYIISKLTPILRTDPKSNQLQALALKEGKHLHEILSYFYQGGSTDEETQNKRTIYARLNATISKLGNPGKVDRAQAFFQGTPWHRFGLFQRDLTYSDDECYEIFNRPESIPLPDKIGKDDTSFQQATPQRPVVDESFIPSEDDILKLFDSDEAAVQPQAPQSGAAGATQALRMDDKATYYRRILETEWQANLERLANDRYKLRYFGFDPKDMKDLIQELKSAAQRLGVFQAIENDVRDVTAYANVNQEAMVWILARIASARLSEFIVYLGFSPRTLPDPKERTVKIAGKDFTLFQTLPEVGEYPVLPDLPPPYDVPYHTSWKLALFQLMIDNVYFAEKTYNIKENERLGTLRTKVAKENDALSDTGAVPQMKLV
ncbi:MAG: putative virulence factor [Deltaproteobacteria bacterium]|jgi:hypothetical protein|nr:putative virulence factor [Deltaproteobacteria bacterium]